MRYMVLIYGSEAQSALMSPAEQTAEMEAYTAFTQAVRASDVLLGGESLVPTSAATTVRVKEGKVLTTDGPFAETKEQLGGFYMLRCDNLDQAIALAARIPGATTGSIEIRPIVEWN